MIHRSTRIARFAVTLLAGALIGGGGYAIAASGSSTIHGCVTKTHELLVKRRCSRGQTRLSWSQRGPAGPTGATGAAGPTGPTGPQGVPGQNAVGQWEVVNASGQYVAGADFGISHSATGDYLMSNATGARNCAIQITPDNTSNGVTVPPIIASVANGFPVQDIYLTNTSGQGVDDGFSVTVQC